MAIEFPVGWQHYPLCPRGVLMYIRRLVPLVLAVAVASCGDSGSLSPSLPLATFSISTVDGLSIPLIISADTACQTINAGGWLSFEQGHRYTMAIDRIGVLCGGTWTTGNLTVQRGGYTVRGDSVDFRADPPAGPDFTAAYDPGTNIPHQGGRLPNLTFAFVGHDYFLVSDGLIGVRSGVETIP